jgi:predicted enzyme related to lactoylglutathione lyase
MAKVLGVGGVFFRSKDPKALAGWYAKHLNVPVDESWGGAAFQTDTVPPGGATIWSPFAHDTKYFDPAPDRPSDRQLMINLMVDDLDGALSQVKAGGGEVVGEIDDQPYGRFGWFLDPDGNKVELWEPKVYAPEAEG